MAFLRKIFDWFKANYFVVGAALFALVAFGIVAYVHMQGAQFVTDVSKKADQLKQMETLQRSSVQIPAERADAPQRTEIITINQVAIDQMDSVYKRLAQEFNSVVSYAGAFNREGHLPMLDRLFPDPRADASRPYDARIRYRTILRGTEKQMPEWLQPYSAHAGYPQLNAKGPPSPADRQRAIDGAVDQFTSSGIRALSSFTPSELAKLEKDKQEALVKMCKDYAISIHIYAQTDPEKPEYPFAIMGWEKFSANAPTDEDIWEGQMQLWMQQDICRAIMLTNRVDSKDANVSRSPIKRLLGIEIVPGVIGGQPKPGATVAGKLPVTFSTLTSSGRVTNPLYEVRHLRLKLVADYRRLPEFFDNLAQVNFMTVLRMDVKDEDEYQALREGYFYGEGDMVRVNMLIETIWLRDWLKDLMPNTVLVKSGMPARAGATITPLTPLAPLAPEPAVNPQVPDVEPGAPGAPSEDGGDGSTPPFVDKPDPVG